MTKYHSVEQMRELKKEKPEIYKSFHNTMVNGSTNTMRLSFYLDLLEEFFNEKEYRVSKNQVALEKTLKELGFELHYIPSLTKALVSSVNLVVLDDSIIVPSLGFKDFDNNVFEELSLIAPDKKIIQVNSLHQMSLNGGAHCSINVTR